MSEPLLDLCGVRRGAEQEPLHLVTARGPQLLELARALDALGDDRQPERMAERRDRLDDPEPLRATVAVVHERTVNLDDVDLQSRQMGERRVAGAEVVDRDPDAEVAERMEI